MKQSILNERVAKLAAYVARSGLRSSEYPPYVRARRLTSYVAEAQAPVSPKEAKVRIKRLNAYLDRCGYRNHSRRRK